MEQVTVELATAGDWPAVCRIFSNAGQAAWGHIVDAAALQNLYPPDRWHEAVINPVQRTAVFVGKIDGVALGFIVVRASGDEDATPETGEVDSFYTDPSAWGQGLGQALMRQGLESLKGFGFKTTTLWTEHRNHRPREFYVKNGWSLDGTERCRETRGSQLVELRYRRTLASEA